MNLEKLANFLEDFSIEHQHFWKVNDSQDSQNAWLIRCFKDSNHKQLWNMQKTSNDGKSNLGNPHEFSMEDLIGQPGTSLSFCKTDLSKQIINDILTMGVFSKLVLQQIDELLGKQALEKAFENHMQFSDKLEKAVTSVAGKNKSHLRLIKS